MSWMDWVSLGLMTVTAGLLIRCGMIIYEMKKDAKK